MNQAKDSDLQLKAIFVEHVTAQVLNDHVYL